MAQRRWRVVVLAASRGYDDPSVKYDPSEMVGGVEIKRLPFSSFGKRTVLLRLVGGILFTLQAILRGLFTKDLECVLVSTSPPMCSAAAWVIAVIRRVPIKYWVMDLNPDQMVALGRAGSNAWFVRLFKVLNRAVLARAADVLTLDRFMAERLIDQYPQVQNKLTVLPLWPLEPCAEPIGHQDNPFRAEHGLGGKFVIMYSGNLSVASPLDTVLEAALQLQDESDLVFMFIGGGLGKKKLDEFVLQHRPGNIVSLPYQPLARIKYSLSAADVHLIAMGEAIVGICHPSKVYGAMSVGKPILLLAPELCYLTEMITEHRLGWRIAHGDTAAAVEAIRQIARTDPGELTKIGASARALTEGEFSREKLCEAVCQVIEKNIS
jgi:glycosyltransferase involved in cell wall biosynthesis